MRGQIPQPVPLWQVTKMDKVEVADKDRMSPVSPRGTHFLTASLSSCALISKELHIVPLKISTVSECSPINLHDGSRK